MELWVRVSRPVRSRRARLRVMVRLSYPVMLLRFQMEMVTSRVVPWTYDRS